MKQGLLPWSPCQGSVFVSYPSSIVISFAVCKTREVSRVSATLESSSTQELTAKERRRMRNERRETKGSNNWKEEVEDMLLVKPKKRFASWTDELNLDNLALLGPQWWVVRVARIRYEETAERLPRLLVRNFPEIEFKVYAPVVQVKRKLKNGSYSVKPKPLFPGCVFLRCVLNKDIHDFIRECEGVGGFIGSKVGNTKRQINKPRPISDDDIEAIFQQAKEEQEKTDQAFEEEEKLGNRTPNTEKLDIVSHVDSKDVTLAAKDSKPKRRSRRISKGKDDKLLAAGSTVRVVSGTFAEFIGSLKKLNHKTGKATVGFTLFGKESLVDLDLNEIVADAN